MARSASPTDDPHWRRLYEATRTLAAADAQQCISAGATPHLAHDLVATSIARLEQTIAADPKPPVRACRRGCGWCCHQPVFVTAPEAVVIVAHLRATWSAERIAHLRSLLAARAAERRTQINDRTQLAAGLPCVFLDEENSCTIHAARPLTCRGITSSSAEACAERYINPAAPPPPIDPHGHTAIRAVLHGLSAALTGTGLAGGMAELSALVLQLLSDEGGLETR
jgi:Fe-S-cluster containining protein